MLDVNWSLELAITDTDDKITYVNPQPTTEITKYAAGVGLNAKPHLDQLEVIFLLDDKCIRENARYFANLKKTYVCIKIEKINVASACIMANNFVPIGDGTVENATCITNTVKTYIILQREVQSKTIRNVVFRSNFSDMEDIFHENFRLASRLE